MAIQLIDTVTPDIGLKTVADKLNANFSDANNAAAALVVGTVSQTGGVSDGAIIERGSNVNGEYVKYADGTMICSALNSQTTAPTETQFGQWIFPASFVNSSCVIFGYLGNSNFDVSFHIDFGVPTKTSIQYQVVRLVTSTNSMDSVALGAIMCVIGRWY